MAGELPRLCEPRSLSEPKERARRIARVAPDIVRWSVRQGAKLPGGLTRR